MMVNQVKMYNITVRGKVQDVSFRDYIIAIANISNIRGFIFNDVDGTVKMILAGAKETVTSFLNEIKSRKYATGVEIESLQQKELTEKFDLPEKFVKLSTDDMWDIDRKLGLGNEYLAKINNGIDDLKANTSDIKNGINSLNTKFDMFFEKQNEHNVRLEKILEKLTEE